MLVVAILTSILERICHRFFMRKLDDSVSYTLLYQVIASLSLIIFMNYEIMKFQFDNTSLESWFLLFVSSVLWLVFGILSFKSDKLLEASQKAIISRARIIWALGIGVLFFGESVSVSHGLGILLIASAIFIHYRPSASINKEGLRLEIGASFAIALAMGLDKYLSQYFPISFLTFSAFFTSALLLVFFMKNPVARGRNVIRKSGVYVLIPGILGAISYCALISALKFGDLGVVLPVYQGGTMLTVLVAMVVLNESDNWKLKILSGALAFAGAALIYLEN